MVCNQFGTYLSVRRKYCQSIKSIRHRHIFLLETFPSTLLWIFLPFCLMFLIFLCLILLITWSVSIRVSLGSSSHAFSVYNLSLADIIKSIAYIPSICWWLPFCIPGTDSVSLFLSPCPVCVTHIHVYTHTLKISNCRSSRHIPLCSKKNLWVSPPSYHLPTHLPQCFPSLYMAPLSTHLLRFPALSYYWLLVVVVVFSHSTSRL